ncbi:hypothetical protein CAEBREN_02909 [Caenorhabditis brenneri]|uniref:F-box domain-containing protein n=1 Tax=Caenorhabditis brenneri TaxID=135651 RepID=G0NAC8_CAEBE|nr:hypothetical protein CAEBREN_02909 [Caenorhabditis brenneri]
MGLPVFSLPQLILQEIIRQLLPGELVCFSLCSRKSYNAVRLLRNKNIKWEFVVSPGTSARISFWFNEGYIKSNLMGADDIFDAPRNCQIIKIKGNSVPYSMDWYHNLRTFWDDEKHGMRAITEYCSELFDNMDVHTLLPDGPSLLWSLNWVTNRQVTPLENIQLSGDTREIGGREFDRFLREVKVTNDLTICWKPPPNFTFTGRLPRCQNINIRKASWLTIDNLLTMDSVVAHIIGSRLRISQINQFLRAWLNGQCAPRLKFLEIRITGVAMANQYLEGIRERAVLEDGILTFYW